MSLTTSEMTPADFAAVTGNNNGFGFGGDGAWWIIILFLFAFAGGWNNGGFGGSSGAADNYVLASDFAQVERKLDTVNAGLCDGFYAMNTGMLNGFSNLGMSVMQGTNAIQSQLAQCCCDTREGIAGINYNLATQGCATNTAIATAARDITDNQNTNARAILDALAQQRTDQLKERIAEQNQQINALQLAASQSAQNQYLINQLRPSPIPAYNVPSPYYLGGCGCGTYGTYGTTVV